MTVPYDPTGSASTNLISAEVHTPITEPDIFPNQGPFYSNGFSITGILKALTNTVNTLGTIVGGSGYTTQTTTTYYNVQLTLFSGTMATSYPTANITVSGGVVTTVALTSNGYGFTDTTTVLTCPANSIGGGSPTATWLVPIATLHTNVAVPVSLNLFVDYNWGPLFAQRSGDTGKEVYSFFLLTDYTKWTSVTITYQATGGDPDTVLLNQITNMGSFDRTDINNWLSIQGDITNLALAGVDYNLKNVSVAYLFASKLDAIAVAMRTPSTYLSFINNDFANMQTAVTTIQGQLSSWTTTFNNIGLLTGGVATNAAVTTAISNALANQTNINALAQAIDTNSYFYTHPTHTWLQRVVNGTGGGSYGTNPSSSTPTWYNNVRLGYSSGRPVTDNINGAGTYPVVNLKVVSGVITDISLVSGGTGFWDTNTRFTIDVTDSGTISSGILGTAGAGFLCCADAVTTGATKNNPGAITSFLPFDGLVDNNTLATAISPTALNTAVNSVAQLYKYASQVWVQRLLLGAPGTGYPDGYYAAVPLQYLWGTGNGSTTNGNYPSINLTVINGSVVNVVLNSGGSGFTDANTHFQINTSLLIGSNVGLATFTTPLILGASGYNSSTGAITGFMNFDGFVDNNALKAATRIKLTSSITIYVNGSTGSDSGNLYGGLSASYPYRTLTAAFNAANNNYDTGTSTGGYSIIIQVADGTYTDDCNLHGSTVNNNIIVQGNSASPTNVVITSAAGSSAFINNAIVTFKNVLFTAPNALSGSQSHCLVAMLGAYVTIADGVTFGTALNNHIHCDGVSTIQVAATSSGYNVQGSAGGSHQYCLGSGVINNIISNICNITAAITVGQWIWAHGGTVYIASNTFTNKSNVTGKYYAVDNHGIIITNGASGTYLPGNSAGTADTATTYVGGNYV